ncbi:MAG: hypothetical protein Q9183_005470 [Haloplaca sp. 2 TL-2023]
MAEDLLAKYRYLLYPSSKTQDTMLSIMGENFAAHDQQAKRLFDELYPVHNTEDPQQKTLIARKLNQDAKDIQGLHCAFFNRSRVLVALAREGGMLINQEAATAMDLEIETLVGKVAWWKNALDSERLARTNEP